MEWREMIFSESQLKYQQQLKAMYQQNDQQLRPHDLRRTLYDYFMLLERTIAGKQITEGTDCELSITELEVIIQYLEALLKKRLEQQQLIPGQIAPFCV